MSLTNSQYNTIMHDYTSRQSKNHQLYLERLEAMHRFVPELKNLEDQITSCSISLAKNKALGIDEQSDSIRDTLKQLQDKKEQLLLSKGFSLKDLEPSYDCMECLDTGYINNQKCTCFKQAIIKLLYKQSNIQELLEEQNFSMLSKEFYTGEDLKFFEQTLENSYSFIKNFNSDFNNLFFYGTVGTGKSFLSGCIAKELIDLGNSVIYFSSSALIEQLSTYSFSFDSKDKDILSDMYNDLYCCDLLIIDDLGTELTTAFTSSQLFSCLNERIMRKKSTIISTNLSLKDLQDRYSDRIFSRITSNFLLCKMVGPDIRMLKKRLEHRK